MPDHPTAYLKHGREKSLLRRHPWVFSGAIARIAGNPQSGDTIDVRADGGEFLARGAYSPKSQIRIRVWTFDSAENPTPDFFRARLSRAIEFRRRLGLLEPRGACRLVNAEADGLPGVIVDRYAGLLVCQFLSAGAERQRDAITEQLTDLLPTAGVFERSDETVRDKEGLPPRTGAIHGAEPPEFIEIEEGPCRFLVDPRNGHKTGFYLDQRENRAALGEFVANGHVLNAFAYTGGFGIAALKAGAASVVNIEASAAALDLCRRHMELNGLDPAQTEMIEGNVFGVLRGFRNEGRAFDSIVLDPPKFAESAAQLDGAARGYKDINLLAFKILRPGGTLFTFSCSGLLAPDLFQKIVADAALDAGRDAQIIRRLGQSADHPTALSFPEASYLKGLVCRVA